MGEIDLPLRMNFWKIHVKASQNHSKMEIYTGDIQASIIAFHHDNMDAKQGYYNLQIFTIPFKQKKNHNWCWSYSFKLRTKKSEDNIFQVRKLLQGCLDFRESCLIR